MRAGSSEIIAGGTAAAQHDDVRVPAVVGDQFSDTRGHLASVAEDVADEVPRDPVVDADVLMLATSVAEPALGDSHRQVQPGKSRKITVSAACSRIGKLEA